MTEISIRHLAADDLRAVADVHVAAFPSSALTKLGAEAVRRYYQWQLEGPHDASTIGIFVDDELAGFLVGGVFRGAMAGFLRENRVYLIRRLLARPWLVANPIVRDRLRVASRALAKQSRPRSARTVKSPSPTRPSPFGILSIAVHPARQGLGLGQRLMREAEAAAVRRGFREMSLTVDPRNAQGIAFYRRLDWQPVSVGHEWCGQMAKHLPDVDA